ncbi:uncharacterized protein LOC122672433 [Telopea speciosissima]|uniref:uncharacterized protein LOC122672433 n=1 Tax=Telopea speciosissima TaxID=54955 RepID=UPI001CC6BF61|nr:uncharacterized protein LOC122672433 [Telopea speciosissima]
MRTTAIIKLRRTNISGGSLAFVGITPVPFVPYDDEGNADGDDDEVVSDADRPYPPNVKTVDETRYQEMELGVANDPGGRVGLSVVDLGGFLGFPALEKGSNKVEKPLSYATVAKPRLPEIDSLPSPVRDGNLTRIKIPQAAYVEQLDKMQHSLLGRVNFRFTTMDRLHEATQRWPLKEGVSLRSIGKGFVIFTFSNADDMTVIWRRCPIRVDNQLLRFQLWRKEFRVQEQAITHRLTWIRFPNLPQEYWHEAILLSIAEAVGRPIAIDRRTKHSHYGHYARVCVDID